MERQVIFVKRYTAISSLQPEHKVIYFISWSESGLPYGVGIRREESNYCYEEFESHIISKREDAEELALFLYEKAVAPEHLHDILRDIKVSGSIKM